MWKERLWKSTLGKWARKKFMHVPKSACPRKHRFLHISSWWKVVHFYFLRAFQTSDREQGGLCWLRSSQERFGPTKSKKLRRVQVLSSRTQCNQWQTGPSARWPGRWTGGCCAPSRWSGFGETWGFCGFWFSSLRWCRSRECPGEREEIVRVEWVSAAMRKFWSLWSRWSPFDSRIVLWKWKW